MRTRSQEEKKISTFIWTHRNYGNFLTKDLKKKTFSKLIVRFKFTAKSSFIYDSWTHQQIHYLIAWENSCQNQLLCKGRLKIVIQILINIRIFQDTSLSVLHAKGYRSDRSFQQAAIENRYTFIHKCHIVTYVTRKIEPSSLFLTAHVLLVIYRSDRYNMIHMIPSSDFSGQLKLTVGGWVGRWLTQPSCLRDCQTTLEVLLILVSLHSDRFRWCLQKLVGIIIIRSLRLFSASILLLFIYFYVIYLTQFDIFGNYKETVQLRIPSENAVWKPTAFTR